MFLASFILKIFLVKIFLWKYLWWKWKYFWKIFMVKEKIFLVKIFLVKIFLAKIFWPPLLTAHPLWPYINPHPFSTPHQWFLKLSVTHEGRTYGARRQGNISTDNIFNTVAVGEVLPVAILASTRQQGPVWIQTAWNNKSSLAEQNHDLYPGNSYNLSGYIIVLYCEGWVSKWYIILKYTLFTASPQPTCRQKCTIHYCLHHFAWCSGQAAAGESCSAPPACLLPASLLPNYSFI